MKFACGRLKCSLDSEGTLKMSSGHGVIQRRILEILKREARELTALELTERVFEIELSSGHWQHKPWLTRHLVSESQNRSVRRALRKLEREGLILRSRSDWAGRLQLWRLPGVPIRRTIAAFLKGLATA